MTNHIEEPSNLIHEQRKKLVSKIIKLQQSVDRKNLQMFLLNEKNQSFDSTSSQLYRQHLDGEHGNGTAAYYVDVLDGDGDSEKPTDDSNSDEDNCAVLYDSDGDDDTRSYFPCPFCYVGVEVPVFCSHLQQEHCFDLKNAVCPLCAANLGKDAIRHFIAQHSSSLKQRKKSEQSNFWCNNLAMLGKKQATNGRETKHESTPDPLLSPFICNVSVPSPNRIHQDELSSNKASVILYAKSNGTYAKGDGQDHQETRQRAAFVQQLIASTIF